MSPACAKEKMPASPARNKAPMVFEASLLGRIKVVRKHLLRLSLLLLTRITTCCPLKCWGWSPNDFN